MKNTHHNEVDLFAHIQTLWNSKLFIGVFLLLAILFASVITVFTTPIYTKQIKVSIDNTPVGYSRGTEALIDFRTMFYSKKVFEDWKRQSNSPIVFENFNRITNSTTFIESKKNTRTSFVLLKKGINNSTAYIRVSSDELSLSNDYFNYANYVNDLLIPKFVKKANEERLRINKRYKKSTETNIHIIKLLLSADRYISKLEQGSNIIRIEPPINQKKIKPRPRIIFIVSIFIGLLFGITFAIFRHAYRQRQNNL